MVWARHYRFNRRIGEGISVFNPGDQPVKNNVIHNFADSGTIEYASEKFIRSTLSVFTICQDQQWCLCA